MLILLNGDEVVGKYKRSDDRMIVLDDAVMLFSDLEDTGQVMIRKYCMFSHTWEARFKHEHVVMEVGPDEITTSLAQFYLNTLNRFKEGPYEDPLSDELVDHDEDEDEEEDTKPTRTMIH